MTSLLKNHELAINHSCFDILTQALIFLCPREWLNWGPKEWHEYYGTKCFSEDNRIEKDYSE